MSLETDLLDYYTHASLLELGRSLKLPPWLEPTREQIAASLGPLTLDDVP